MVKTPDTYRAYIVAWIYYSAQLRYFGAEFTHVYATSCGALCEVSPQESRAEHARQRSPAYSHAAD